MLLGSLDTYNRPNGVSLYRIRCLLAHAAGVSNTAKTQHNVNKRVSLGPPLTRRMDYSESVDGEKRSTVAPCAPAELKHPTSTYALRPPGRSSPTKGALWVS